MRYFFDVQHAGTLTKDEEGAEFPSAEAARDEATASAVDLVIDSLRAGHGLNLDRAIRVRDDHGELVAEIQFGDAVQPQGERRTLRSAILRNIVGYGHEPQ